MYGLEHLRRLQAIERARARGASLSLIASHLAEGRPLEEDTLISWQPDPAPPDIAADAGDAAPPGRAQRAEIGPLLAKLDHQRDPAAQAQVEALIAAGVFQQVGHSVFTGRDLAAALTALQRQGLPMEMALGVAQRAMAAALPIADQVRRSIADLDSVAATVTGHFGDVAGCVMRHVVAEHEPG